MSARAYFDMPWKELSYGAFGALCSTCGLVAVEVLAEVRQERGRQTSL